MDTNDMQKALDTLANDINAAVRQYLESTEHTHTPTISIEYIVAHSIGQRHFEPTVTVSGELTGVS